MDELTTRERADLRDLVHAAIHHDRRRLARRGRAIAGGVGVLAVAAIVGVSAWATLRPDSTTAAPPSSGAVGTWVSTTYAGVRLDIAADGTLAGTDTCGTISGTWADGDDGRISVEAEHAGDCEGRELALEGMSTIRVDGDSLISDASSSATLSRVADDRVEASGVIGSWDGGGLVLRPDGTFRMDTGCTGIQSGRWLPLTDGRALLVGTGDSAEAVVCAMLKPPSLYVQRTGEAVRVFAGTWPEGGASPGEARERSSIDGDAPVGEWQTAPGGAQSLRLTIGRDGSAQVAGLLCDGAPTLWRGVWRLGADGGGASFLPIGGGSCDEPNGVVYWDTPDSSAGDRLVFTDAYEGTELVFERVR